MVKVNLPFIGGGKERAGLVASEPLPMLPKDDAHRESVVTIWSMGKTPIDVVEDGIIKQFPGLDAQELSKMVSEVEAKRNKVKKAGC